MSLLAANRAPPTYLLLKSRMPRHSSLVQLIDKPTLTQFLDKPQIGKLFCLRALRLWVAGHDGFQSFQRRILLGRQFVFGDGSFVGAFE